MRKYYRLFWTAALAICLVSCVLPPQITQPESPLPIDSGRVFYEFYPAEGHDLPISGDPYGVINTRQEFEEFVQQPDSYGIDFNRWRVFWLFLQEEKGDNLLVQIIEEDEKVLIEFFGEPYCYGARPQAELILILLPISDAEVSHTVLIQGRCTGPLRP